MKLFLSLLLLVAFIPAVAQNVPAQETEEVKPASAAELRDQLSQVQAKEAELQSRVKQLDEALKPENISRSLAGIGSTKPEELRELRRRELTIERDGINNQLKLLASSRTRLESTLRTAEAHEYQQSANGSLNQLSGKAVNSPRLMLFIVIAALTVLAAGVTLVVIRKRVLS